MNVEENKVRILKDIKNILYAQIILLELLTFLLMKKIIENGIYGIVNKYGVVVSEDVNEYFTTEEKAISDIYSFYYDMEEFSYIQKFPNG